MKTTDFRHTLITDRTPEEVFKAIGNARGWWKGFHSEEFDGGTEKLDDEFVFRAGEGAHYSKHKVVETIPGKKIVWLVTDSELNFIENKYEWTGTKMIFEISKKGDKTQLVFTHEGLVPEVECYDVCAPSWSQYLEEGLLPLIER